jgi:tetratricopeptide (TPR) repeat protein
MASVFLSYDHEDMERAAPIAAALENAGHTVWWDRQIHGGAEYNSEIEGAVAAADVVVVLWTERSVRSAWVRDEAAEGRDRGKLVPLAIDGTKPPMGFRQYQTIRLPEWRGRKQPPQIAELLHAINKVALSAPPEKPPVAPSVAQPQKRTSRRRWVASGGIVVALIALGLLLWRPWASSPGSLAAVVAADSSHASQEYAQDLLTKLGQLQSARAGAFELVGPDERRRADLVFEVAGSGDRQQVRANLVLVAAKGRGLLWSKSFERPAGKSGDLREELSFAAAQVLNCAIESHRNGRAALRPEILRLYLNGCAELGDPDLGTISDLISTFRRVTAAAPNFEGGWAKLLLAEGEALSTSGPEADRLKPDLRRDIASARKLHPDMPEVYIAEISLLPFSAFGKRLELADRGITLNPDNSQLLVMRSSLRQAVGRTSYSLDDARRAVEFNPISPATRGWYITSLAASGRTDAALKELEEAEKIWPGSSSVRNARFALHFRYGDPRIAWQSIQSGKTASGWIEAKNFLQARLDPTPENVSRAIKDARAAYAEDYSNLHHLVQVLSILNREDELLQLLMSVPVRDAAFVTDVTFRPAAREFWHDPRALGYAKRIGLLQYWQSSGNWPDFCGNSDLPYDCKKEAARLSA